MIPQAMIIIIRRKDFVIISKFLSLDINCQLNSTVLLVSLKTIKKKDQYKKAFNLLGQSDFLLIQHVFGRSFKFTFKTALANQSSQPIRAFS